MEGIKITIECNNPLLKATIGAIIAEALANNGITQVQVKTILVYQQTVNDLPGEAPRVAGSPLYHSEMLPPAAAFGDTSTVMTALLDKHGGAVLSRPVLIDPTFSDPGYHRIEAEYLGKE